MQHVVEDGTAKTEKLLDLVFSSWKKTPPAWKPNRRIVCSCNCCSTCLAFRWIDFINCVEIMHHHPPYFLAQSFSITNNSPVISLNSHAIETELMKTVSVLNTHPLIMLFDGMQLAVVAMYSCNRYIDICLFHA